MEDNKTYTVYIHKVDTDEGPVYYTGVTTDVKQRWRQCEYKGTALWLYIEQFGWDNIKHVVVIDGLTYKKSREVEDMLIHCYKSLGRCINQRRSGLIEVSDHQTYIRKYMYNRRKNDTDFAKRQRLSDNKHKRAILATPEGKIYNRVNGFNRRHPDRAIETPLEAKRKYLESGYIPDYIKRDDL